MSVYAAALAAALAFIVGLMIGHMLGHRDGSGEIIRILRKASREEIEAFASEKTPRQMWPRR